MPVVQIDFKSGEFTYGQRIGLGKIFAEPKDDYTMYAEVIKYLHGYDVKPVDDEILVPYFNSIIEGLNFWVEAEKRLKYEPTVIELQAGIFDYISQVGELATIKSLAKAYAQDPDTITEWKYNKVFGILLTDLHEYRYRERYDKVIERRNGK